MSVVDQEANAGTAEVRAAHRFDEEALVAWMSENISGFSGSLKVEEFKGGQSNPTYKLMTPDRNYVLRRKPPGPILKGAHSVEREARILKALYSQDFPVAKVYGECADESVIGSPFYIMEMVEGRIFWDARFPAASREERPALFDAMNETIASLHCIDYKKAGLEDFGKTGNYLERQIALWTRQYVQDEDAGRDPDMDFMLEWFPRNIPEGDETTIVHGDFKCDNMIFHPTEPKVIAVLDWELSTLGDPLVDFAYHAMMYDMPPEIIAGLQGADVKALNIPSLREYIEAYCRRTGRKDIPNWNFYVAFNYFRLAAIFHGIKGRVIRGTAASAHAKDRAASFPVCVALAKNALEACG